MSVVVYMPLENEDGWRPVHADLVAGDVYEITVEQEPRGEKWKFPPHSRVRCREHEFEDGVTGLLAYELAEQ